MNDGLSDKDKALWHHHMKEDAEEKDIPEEESFSDLIDTAVNNKNNKQKTKEIQTSKPAITTQKQNIREPLDQTLARKLKQGKIKPDYILDLHGLNQQDAFHQLQQTAITHQTNVQKILLVITGKGKATATADQWLTAGRGILKQKLPEWITSSPLNNIVIDAIPAHARHGGGRAYYVILRKKK